MSVVILAVVGIVDYYSGVELSFSIFYLVPVALVTWHFGRWIGVTMGVACALVWVLADVLSSATYSTPIVPYWNATVMFGFFFSTAFGLSTLKRTIDDENRLAREIQERLLPTEMPQVEGYEISGAWRPARFVSGDYYDVMRLDDNSVFLCVGDVVGHGIPAALLMSNLQASVRMLVLKALPPQDICKLLNAVISNHTHSDKFITFFCCVLDIHKREIAYTNAGHCPPVIVRSNGTISLTEGGLPIAMLPGSCYNQGTVKLEDGEVMVIYTDGVVEVSNTENQRFGEHRLLDVLKKNYKRGANATCGGILSAVSEFSKGNYQDDLAVLIVSAHEARPE